MKLNYKVEEEMVVRKKLVFTINDQEIEINLSRLNKGKMLKICDIEGEKAERFDKIVIDEEIYYLYYKKSELYITKNPNRIWRKKSNLHSMITKNNIIFYGLYSNIENRYKDCDNIYLNDKKVGKIKRPLNFWKFKHLAIIKVSLDDILNSGEVHNTISIGDNDNNYIPIKLKKKSKAINYYSRKRVANQYILIRSTVSSGSIRVVNINMQPEYMFKNLFKNNIAWFISKIIGKKNIILMFEKESNKANESGYYIFEKLMKKQSLKSNIYFVINKDSEDYIKVKEKYPNNILEKYKFKHYLYIYISKYFISSELSNHVINPRLYIKNINKEIASKPLIFLQHGIMFAKPVDNPAAAGFKKNNSSVNFYKCIISSKLEATQFYKLGFTDNDLIKCGLTKFDVSKQSKTADKILFMPTYRYWEEGLVMNPNTIKETTYYKTYMNVIKEFEKRNLLDRLIISCHPKFADCLINSNPIYQNIIEKDINKGLENCKVFITDYSSASYDAHYRGAYIIYYWAEKDYLIENYQAEPPINEENCDGVPVYSAKELLDEVERAIKKDYKMDKKYNDRYMKINEFHDGKNGDRLIEELEKLNII